MKENHLNNIIWYICYHLQHSYLAIVLMFLVTTFSMLSSHTLNIVKLLLLEHNIYLHVIKFTFTIHNSQIIVMIIMYNTYFKLI